MPGYIKLYRDLQENPLWYEKPFDRARAWVDMIFRCNHRCIRMGPQYQNVLVRRGSFIESNVKLGEYWGWNERRVRRFMKYLSERGMIVYQPMTKFCIYMVSKYAEFQALDNTVFEAYMCRTDAEQMPSKRRTGAEQVPTNNNDNNNTYTDNYNKRTPFEFSPGIFLTHDELNQFTNKCGKGLSYMRFMNILKRKKLDGYKPAGTDFEELLKIYAEENREA